MFAYQKFVSIKTFDNYELYQKVLGANNFLTPIFFNLHFFGPKIFLSQNVISKNFAYFWVDFLMLQRKYSAINNCDCGSKNLFWPKQVLVKEI